MILNWKRPLLVVAILSPSASPGADPSSLLPDMPLDSVVQVALRENPDIRSAGAGWEAMRERPDAERALPNPMFTYGGMDAIHGGSFPVTGEKRFTLEQEIPWFGKRGLRGEAAEKEAEVARGDYEAVERRIIFDVKENYFGLRAVRSALAIARAEEDVLGRILEAAEARYAAGEAGQQDVLEA